MKWKLADQRNDASPFPIVYTESACGKNSSMYKALNVCWQGFVSVFEGISWSYYEVDGDSLKLGQELAQKVLQDPLMVEKAIKETYRLGKLLLELTNEISTADLTKKTNAQLWQYYEDYGKRFKATRGPGWIAPALDMSEVFTKILINILKQHLPKGKEDEESIYFTQLTNPSSFSKAKQEQIDLLKLAAELTTKEKTILWDRKPLNLELLEKVKIHHQKYCWLPCTYEGPAWDLDHFVTELVEIIKQKLEPQEELEKIEKQKQKVEVERAAAIEELGLNKEEQKLFQIASEIILFKGDRKDIFFQSYYEMRLLLTEIGRRLKLSLREVRFLLPNDVKAALLEDKLDRQELQQRLSFCIMISENNASKMISGQPAREFMKQNAIEEEAPVMAQELKGTCAYPGKVQGIVKIIMSPRDMPKMNEKDILVSPATNPDIVAAMKKAAAIVTNTGGITCHAAIVAREFRTPCVVGTKIATKVLKDGDLVEVDATKGIVTKVQEIVSSPQKSKV